MHSAVPDPGLVWPASWRHGSCFELAAGARCLHLHAAAPVIPPVQPSAAVSGRLQRQGSNICLTSPQLWNDTPLLVTATQTIHVQCCNIKQ